MSVTEYVPLAPLTTLGVGGEARFFLEAHREENIDEAITLVRKRNLPLFVLGGGSNILVPDSGVEGVVLKMLIRGIEVEENSGDVSVRAGAGVSWDAVVDEVGQRGVHGIENLAGIPGSLGGAAVQNIGAYGVELSAAFDYADAVHGATGERLRITRADADFAYRSSFFKKHPEVVITRVTLRLPKGARPNLNYPDVARAEAAGTPLSTPVEIARAIRAIRAKKFPSAPSEGTAGSFFKNPIISNEQYTSLARRFSGMPAFPQGNDRMKIPLAWLLDRVLHLKGHAVGLVRLYESQPLVVVARVGARARDIDAFARDIEKHVLEETGLTVEREVEMFGARS